MVICYDCYLVEKLSSRRRRDIGKRGRIEKNKKKSTTKNWRRWERERAQSYTKNSTFIHGLKIIISDCSNKPAVYVA